METLITAIRTIRIKQILTVFLASSLLVISTACSNGNLAQTGGKVYTDTAKRAMSDTYDDYDANQSFQGGMNGYNDDPRYDSKTQAKAKALVDAAKSRQKDNLSDYADSITDRAGDKIEQAKQDIPRNLEKNRQEAVTSLKERSDTLKENISNIPDEAQKVFDGATDTARDALKDASQATQKTAQEIKGNIKDLT